MSYVGDLTYVKSHTEQQIEYNPNSRSGEWVGIYTALSSKEQPIATCCEGYSFPWFCTSVPLTASAAVNDRMHFAATIP